MLGDVIHVMSQADNKSFTTCSSAFSVILTTGWLNRLKQIMAVEMEHIMPTWDVAFHVFTLLAYGLFAFHIKCTVFHFYFNFIVCPNICSTIKLHTYAWISIISKHLFVYLFMGVYMCERERKVMRGERQGFTKSECTELLWKKKLNLSLLCVYFL